MRLLLDVGASPKTAEFLRSQGHDAIHLHDLGLGSLGDAEILRMAEAQDRVLVTFDLDFPRLAALQKRFKPSIILFRVQKLNTLALNGRIVQLISHYEAELLAGAIISVEQTGERHRTLPL